MCLSVPLFLSLAWFDEELHGPAVGVPTDQEVWLCAVILRVAMVKSALATESVRFNF